MKLDCPNDMVETECLAVSLKKEEDYVGAIQLLYMLLFATRQFHVCYVQSLGERSVHYYNVLLYRNNQLGLILA